MGRLETDLGRKGGFALSVVVVVVVVVVCGIAEGLVGRVEGEKTCGDVHVRVEFVS